MVRFVQYWIERGMEKPEDREEKARKHFEVLSANAKEQKKIWAGPMKTPGYWTMKEPTATTKQRLSQAEANILSPYERVLKDMDDEERAKAALAKR